MPELTIKQQLCIYLQQLIAEKKQELALSIASLKESRDNDSKSSVGDKHETSRALVQAEIDKLEVQLGKTLHLEKDLFLLHSERVHHQIESGSLVITNYENYFISIGLGKVEFEGKIFYCISLASPIGKALHGKKVGDHMEFNGRKMEVKQVL